MLIADMRRPGPTWGDMARNQAGSAYSNLWDGLGGAWAPELGRGGETTLRSVIDPTFDLTMTFQGGGSVPATYEFTPDGYKLRYVGASESITRLTTRYAEHEPVRDLTVTAWWTRTGSQGTFSPILQNGQENSSAPFTAWAVNHNNTADDDLRIVLNTTADNNLNVNFSTTFADGGTYFLAATYDGSTIRTYVDGAETNSGSQSGDIVGYDGGNASGLITGAQVDLDRHVSGDIGVIYIYHRALAPYEIQQLYIDPLAPFRPKARIWQTTAVAGAVLPRHPLRAHQLNLVR